MLHVPCTAHFANYTRAKESRESSAKLSRASPPALEHLGSASVFTCRLDDHVKAQFDPFSALRSMATLILHTRPNSWKDLVRLIGPVRAAHFVLQASHKLLSLPES